MTRPSDHIAPGDGDLSDWDPTDDWPDDDQFDGDVGGVGDNEVPDTPGRRRSGRQRLLIAVGLGALALLFLGALAAGRIWWKWGQFERVDTPALSEPVEADEPVNFLIVGSDSREAIDSSDPNAALYVGGGDSPAGRRADTMVVLRYDPAQERLDILSIPRDLWVPIAGTDRTERINTAYSGEDGANTLIETVQDNLGIPIHHYAEVDFLGFQSLVEQLGGVPMYFETIYQDTNSGFIISDPGCVVMDGHMALAFVRSRNLQHMNPAGYWETDPSADLGRISRQQQFLRAALSRARGKLSLTNYSDYSALLDIGVEHVRLDSELEPTVLAAMGQRFAEFEGDSIQSHTLPVEGFTTDGGAAVVRLDPVQAEAVLEVFRGDPAEAGPDDPDGPEGSGGQPVASVELVVLNGSGVRGQAGEVQEALREIGYTVDEVGDVFRPEGENLAHSRIRYGPLARADAEVLDSHLSTPAELVEDTTLGNEEIILETGTDFTTVTEDERPDATPDTAAEEPATTTTAPPTTIVGHVPSAPPAGEECG